MTTAAAASHQRRADERPDGHDPRREVDDQREGVEHDQRLDRVPRHQPQQRDQTEHSDDQPADDEKADPHDSRCAMAAAPRVGLSCARWCQGLSA
jgi:hypothetical protein